MIGFRFKGFELTSKPQLHAVTRIAQILCSLLEEPETVNNAEMIGILAEMFAQESGLGAS